MGENKKWGCGGTLTRCCSDVGAGVAAAVAAAAAASGGGTGAAPAVRGHGEEAIGCAVIRRPVCREAGAEKFLLVNRWRVRGVPACRCRLPVDVFYFRRTC